MEAKVSVSIAFDAGPLEPEPTWTRLEDTDGVTVDDWSLDKTPAGSRARVSLLDRNGTLDPTNPNGPFFEKLNPMKQAAIVVENPSTGEAKTLFRGFVSAWKYLLDPSGELPTDVTLTLTDTFPLDAAR
jgi:hypothetical protein